MLILPYFQKWLVQRSQIETARSQVAQAQKDVASLEAQRRRWQDDDYVKAQARLRLHYVLPGETAYVVQDRAADEKASDPKSQAADVPQARSPWYANVWTSAQVAGGTPGG
ncbi:septum formation initiator family protein [Spongisporangium articulatum]|uniref:Septum formation initiator family protein n=1 Tax=Spongisporangium articulatum TaxID=3362603 RepID=A0ABW8AQP7_9ACTN